MNRKFWALLVLPFFAIACGDDDDPETEMMADGEDEFEVITTLELTFALVSDPSDTTTITFEDADGDGGQSGTFSPSEINLAANESYALTMRLANVTSDEPDEPQEEVSEEDDEHQFFILGSNVRGPARDDASAAIQHAYDDMDDNDLPVGFTNTITTGAAATAGGFRVILRHLPPVDGTAQKVAGLETVLFDATAEIDASSDPTFEPAGFAGESDLDLTFTVGVE
ncbi:MAG: hypothetical protein AAFX94_11590 [Myxococcota bacterium]